jgi:hypothetical protein
MLARARFRPALLIALLALVTAASAAGNACACNGSSLREALMGKSSADGRGEDDSQPAVGRYEAGDGEHFIFDRTGAVALLRFEHSEEVWALRASSAPGGDVIYRNDLNEPVLRLTRQCGVTLYTSRWPQGEPVAFVTAEPAARPPRVSPATLVQTANIATVRIGRAIGRPSFLLKVEGQEGTEFIFADTIAVVADTLIKMASFAQGRPYARGVRQVHIHPGKKMEVKYRGGVLDVTVRPQDGIAGRPSSSRIARSIVSAG